MQCWKHCPGCYHSPRQFLASPLFHAFLPPSLIPTPPSLPPSTGHQRKGVHPVSGLRICLLCTPRLCHRRHAAHEPAGKHAGRPGICRKRSVPHHLFLSEELMFAAPKGCTLLRCCIRLLGPSLPCCRWHAFRVLRHSACLLLICWCCSLLSLLCCAVFDARAMCCNARCSRCARITLCCAVLQIMLLTLCSALLCCVAGAVWSLCRPAHQGGALQAALMPAVPQTPLPSRASQTSTQPHTAPATQHPPFLCWVKGQGQQTSPP